MKYLLFLSLVMMMSACNNSQKMVMVPEGWKEFAEDIHNRYEESEKYEMAFVEVGKTSQDVRIKHGETVCDVYVVSDRSCIHVGFSDPNGKLVRVYYISLKGEGEYALNWSKNAITTNKRVINLNYIQE